MLKKYESKESWYKIKKIYIIKSNDLFGYSLINMQ